MTQIDLRLIYAMTGLSAIIAAFAAARFMRRVPQSRSLRSWYLATGAIAAGLLLRSLIGVLPEFLSLVLAGFLMMLGAGYFHHGTRWLLNRPKLFQWHWAVSLFGLAALLHFTYAAPSMSARMIVVALPSALFCLASAWQFWFHADATLQFNQRLTALAFLGYGVLLTLFSFAIPGAPISSDETTSYSLLVAAPYFYTIAFNIWIAISVSFGVNKFLAQNLVESHTIREATRQERTEAKIDSPIMHEANRGIRGLYRSARRISSLMGLKEAHQGWQDELSLTMLRSGASLRSVVDDIVDLSNIASGNTHETPQAFRPDRVLREAAALMSDAATEKGLRLHAYWQDDPQYECIGDPHVIRQMLMNLIGNGIRLTDWGTVRIDGTVMDRNIEYHTLRFNVTDTAMGLNRDERLALFSDIDNVKDVSTFGSGKTTIGLSIVQTLSRATKGETGAEHDSMLGGSFWFTAQTMPVANTQTSKIVDGKAETLASPDASLPDKAQHAENVAGKPCILLADDNLHSRTTVDKALAALGYHVISVTDGVEAFEILSKGTPIDLLLVDCQMSVLDGYQTTRCVRHREQRNASDTRQRLPVIGLTDEAHAQDIERCFAAGMDDVLMRPVDLDVLSHTLETWCEK